VQVGGPGRSLSAIKGDLGITGSGHLVRISDEGDAANHAVVIGSALVQRDGAAGIGLGGSPANVSYTGGSGQDVIRVQGRPVTGGLRVEGGGGDDVLVGNGLGAALDGG